MDKNPDAFRTISEVGDELSLPQHVLRFWETRFSQIKPMKRAGGRRYYRPDDFSLLQGIRHLLYDNGYTIKGVQKLLKQNGNKYVMAIGEGDMAMAEAIAANKETDNLVNDLDQSRNASISPGEETLEQDKILGQAKTPASHKLFSRKKDKNEDNSALLGTNQSLREEDRALLQETLYDLLECKRLLDQTR